MKRLITALFIVAFTFSGCGDSDETCVAPAGYYKQTLILKQDECKMTDSKKEEKEESTIIVYEDDPILECGAHEYTTTKYRSCVDCNLTEKLSVITTEKNINGQYIATHKCKKGSPGYYIAGGKTECTDIYDLFLKPRQ